MAQVLRFRDLRFRDLRFRDVVVTISGVGLSVGRGSVWLSGRESRLLEALASCPGAGVPHSRTVGDGVGPTATVGALTVAVNHLRVKLARINACQLLRTEPGGYRLAATVLTEPC